MCTCRQRDHRIICLSQRPRLGYGNLQDPARTVSLGPHHQHLQHALSRLRQGRAQGPSHVFSFGDGGAEGATQRADLRSLGTRLSGRGGGGGGGAGGGGEDEARVYGCVALFRGDETSELVAAGGDGSGAGEAVLRAGRRAGVGTRGEGGPGGDRGAGDGAVGERALERWRTDSMRERKKK